MAYWLLKTEPGEWSWEDQKANGGVSQWDGVKNKQAQKNMKAMKEGDLCFFYHSGPRPAERRIVGVVEVIKPWYETGGQGDGAVDVRSRGEMRRTVRLKDVKEDPSMGNFALVRQPRLSVVSVPEIVWRKLCDMGGGFGDDSEEEDDENRGSAEGC
ncbi:thymocyte nuclear-like protein [Wolffia australiana]